MIAGWLLYCIAVSALLAVAAAAIEVVLTNRQRAARGLWAAALIGSFAFPVATYFLPPVSRAPHVVDETRAGGLIARFPSYILDAGPRPADVQVPRVRMPEFVGREGLVVAVVIACIVLAAVRVGFDSILLYRGRRAWAEHTVDGTPVLVSDDLGPAIVGLFESRIVLPRWTLSLAADDRALMLAHEREHVDRRDNVLTTASLFAVIAMPWNPVAWFAWRRLRTAIEVDCDRRVLARFPDVARYGHLLVDVAQRATGSSLTVAGFSERAAPLARRIHAMTTPMARPSALHDSLRGAFGVCCIAGALFLQPPPAPATSDPVSPRQVLVLPKQVGDSIVREHEGGPTVVSAAHDLPSAFELVDYPGGIERGDRPGTCAETIRDPRNATSLKLRVTQTGVTAQRRRGDTTWTRQRSLGYYRVLSAGQYGVGAGQLFASVVGRRSTSPSLERRLLRWHSARSTRRMILAPE